MDTNKLNEYKEQFSLGYIHMLCSAAGLDFDPKGRALDNQGVDITITAPGKVNGVSNVRLDVQVKCTSSSIVDNGDSVKFDLESKNYNRLIATDTYDRQVLIVVHVPDEMTDWVQVKDDKTVSRYCAYWLDLRGRKPTKNKSSIRIKISKDNLLTPESLQQLIEESASKVSLLHSLLDQEEGS